MMLIDYFSINGGEGGIRTHGPAVRNTRFPGAPIRPL